MPDARLPTGVTLHYEQSGLVQDEPLLLVNGLTMDTTTWDALAQILGQEHAVIRYDGRGQGRSDKPDGPYLTMQHAADLVALLDHLELDRVHLIGLSNGGLVSLVAAGELAASQAERIASVTVIDSFAEVDVALQLILDSWRAALDAGGSALRFDVATPWVWGHEFLTQHRDEVLALRDKAAQADPTVVRALIDGLRDFGNAYQSVAAIRCPLLIVVGADDVLTPPRYSKAILEYARNARLEILPGAGHAAPIERPHHVADAIELFLSANDPTPRNTLGEDPSHGLN